ncbi:MAG: putative threonine efflux protein [Massilibacillus sp.]|nr:putative threonine efflux protein [Massilibacillus sp.]
MHMSIPINEIINFIGIVTLLMMLPGPNTILVMQTFGILGRRAALYNIAGIVTAIYIHSFLSAFGLSIIIVKSAQMYMLIKYAGAAYIIYLGVVSIFSVYNQTDDTSSVTDESTIKQKNCDSPFKLYTQGLISNILNPKVALFFLSLFPQFIHNHNAVLVESLMLTFIYTLIAIAWYAILMAFVNKMGSYLENN